VECVDFGTLIGWTYRHAVRSQASVVDDQATPGGCVLHIIGIRGLEPGASEAQVNVKRVDGRKLVIDPVEEILFISLVVYHGKLRRVEEPTSVQPTCGNE